MRKIVLSLLTVLLVFPSLGQEFVVKNGVLVNKNTKKEVFFFGFNYCSAFTHGYRGMERLGLDHKEQYEKDIKHMARLGANAFRVHVWDSQVSDRKGNFIANEHIDMLDFIIAKMAENGISTVLTTMSYGGDGYPERDSPSIGFSQQLPKYRLTIDQESVKAQKNYVTQFVNHVNPYTNKAYKDDNNIIAVEINNEPDEYDSSKSDSVAMYVKGMYETIRKAGWKKPILYNVAQCPNQIEAYMKTPLDGVTFQWYPTGLVSNSSLTDNFLPAVSRYNVPFENVKGMPNKTRWVYEFDAADAQGSYLYPAMARAFREAKFQWATMFAYDPLALADVNTDYQTHYLNLVYSPAKAISILVAAHAFKNLPFGEKYGSYPQNNTFGDYLVDYKQDLSLLNCDTTFAYSNNTTIGPKNAQTLKHIAGHGSSPIVKYDGLGTYFLDKVSDGVWTLEVYPDVLYVNDIHGKSSPERKIAYLVSQPRNIDIKLDDLGANFAVKEINGNDKVGRATGNSISVMPSVYVLSRKGVDFPQGVRTSYVSVASTLKSLTVVHNPQKIVTAGKIEIKAQIAAPQKIETVKLVYDNGRKVVEMVNQNGFDYVAQIDVEAGKMLEYNIDVKTAKEQIIMPQKVNSDYKYWGLVNEKPYRTLVVAPEEGIEIYNAVREPKEGVDVMDMRPKSKILSNGVKVGKGDAVKFNPSQKIDREMSVIQIETSDNNGYELFLFDKDGYMWKTVVGKDTPCAVIDMASIKPCSVEPLGGSYPQFASSIPNVTPLKEDKKLNTSNVTSVAVRSADGVIVKKIILK